MSKISKIHYYGTIQVFKSVQKKKKSVQNVKLMFQIQITHPPLPRLKL